MSVITTVSFALVVFVSPEYCTRIVQEPPELITNPLTQVPPVMVKTPFPPPPCVPSAGFAVRVSGPALAPVAVLLTVIVAFLVPVPPVFKAGTGAEIDTVARLMVKGTAGADVPPGVVTVTFTLPGPAVSGMVNVVLSCVALSTQTVPTVTPPAIFTVVPLVVKLVPVRVTETVEPTLPKLGLMVLRVGIEGTCTVNVTVPLVPFGVLMRTVCAPVVVVGAIVKVAVTCVELTTTGVVEVMLVPEKRIPFAPVRLVPVSVTLTELPLSPEFGLIEVNVGTAPGVVPVPLNPTGEPETATLAVIVAVPLAGAGGAVGEKTTLIVQVDVAARVAVQVPAPPCATVARENGPVNATMMPVAFAVPVF